MFSIHVIRTHLRHLLSKKMAGYVSAIVKIAGYNKHCDRRLVCLDCLISLVAEYNCDLKILEYTSFHKVNGVLKPTQKSEQYSLLFVAKSTKIYKPKNWKFVIRSITDVIKDRLDYRIPDAYKAEYLTSSEEARTKSLLYSYITSILYKAQGTNPKDVGVDMLTLGLFPTELLELIINFF